MRVKFKALHPEAFLPSYANPGDNGLDIYCIDDGTVNRESGYIEYRTGLACEVPDGFVGLLFPRSSISKYSLFLSNSVGVLDSTYRGEITYRFKYTGEGDKRYRFHDRIGQLVIVPAPCVAPEWTETLTESARGSGGYGSTGV